MYQLQDKNILITGGTGSWGQQLTYELLKYNPRMIVIYSRNEFLQVTMQRKFNDTRLRFVIGDVRDKDSLFSACKGIDYIFHLAAIKHIPVCEQFPLEAIKTNIQGTQNIIDAAIHNGVKRVVDVSTDKAANPLNLYGMTKAIGEKLILNANNIDSTKFVCVRGGNVLGSNGSVLQFFIDQIRQSSALTITHEDMTRFFLTIPDAIQLLLTAFLANIDEAIFAMRMPSCKILDLADVLIEKFANNNKINKNITGIRQGEKLHEVLVTECECRNTYEYKDLYYVISESPLILEKSAIIEYCSNSQKLMTKGEIKNLIEKAGY